MTASNGWLACTAPVVRDMDGTSLGGQARAQQLDRELNALGPRDSERRLPSDDVDDVDDDWRCMARPGLDADTNCELDLESGIIIIIRMLLRLSDTVPCEKVTAVSEPVGCASNPSMMALVLAFAFGHKPRKRCLRASIYAIYLQKTDVDVGVCRSQTLS